MTEISIGVGWNWCWLRRCSLRVRLSTCAERRSDIA